MDERRRDAVAWQLALGLIARRRVGRMHAPADVYQVRQSHSNGMSRAIDEICTHARTAKFDKRFRSFEYFKRECAWCLKLASLLTNWMTEYLNTVYFR
jgi:hypothetical protein